MPRQRPPEDSLPALIGRVLQTERETRGYTQEELGLRAGLSKAVIRRYEFGDRTPSWDAFLRLASALRIRPSELVAAFEDWQPPKQKRKKAAA